MRCSEDMLFFVVPDRWNCYNMDMKKEQIRICERGCLMNNVNRTLYIPLYGKAYVSKKDIILHDSMAEAIWEKEGFNLKGKSKSKWLAYDMAMRSAVYDEWLKQEIASQSDAVVLHIGCGMDSRIKRVGEKDMLWYDIDFPAVIEERRKYYHETNFYHMLSADMRLDKWKSSIERNQAAIVILEGVTMYFKPEELITLLSNICQYFKSVKLLMDCYTEHAAKISKYKNPINDVGVSVVYGYDDPQKLATKTGYIFEKEHCMTPQKYIDELQGMEKIIFQNLFAGKIAKSMYRMYEFKKR